MAEFTPNEPEPSKTTFIYALVDPRDGRVRYIGKSNDPPGRLQGHLHGRKYNPYKDRWLAQLAAEGVKPEVVTLEECPAEDWDGEDGRERFWEVHFRDQGERLTNIAPCGGGPPESVLTPEGHRRIVEKAREVNSKEWVFTSPEGVEHRFRNLGAFCEAHDLCKQGMWAVAQGKYLQYRGWTCPAMKAGIEAVRQAAREIEVGRLTSPEGAEHSVTGSVKEFCREHGLCAVAIYGVLRGEHRHHKGWTCPSPEAVAALQSKPPDPRIKTWTGFCSPDGQEVPAFPNLRAFSREHGLHPGSMQQLYFGGLKTHKGWTCNRPEAVEACRLREEQDRRREKGRKRSAETCEKIRQRAIGRKAPPELRQKLSEAHKGIKPTPEAREKKRQEMLARPREWFEKAAAASKAARIANGTGWAHTDETREKCRQATLARMSDRPRVFLDPSGQVVTIENLKEFCQQHALNLGHMSAVRRGDTRQYRGWTCPTAWDSTHPK